ncbi:MAG TPA: IS200/IS605 family transposase [Lentisphaeria bacterium]|nr:MAG: transposase [Lentisphaerae bacterium GWF2_49_21]HBC87136.1 IS200/IS605 family transposase [Lentisphaeria bacterium]
MSNSYISIYIHAVFSTKNHEPFLTSEIRNRLFPYFCGIAKSNDFLLLNAGGIENHLHLLVSLRQDMGTSKALQLLKGGSSKWIHDTFPNMKNFAWQEGYGAFSIGVSQIKATEDYIAKQEQHHRKLSFREEYLAFLKKHNIKYDDKYVFG